MKQHHIVICALVGANLTAFSLHPKPVHSSLDCPQPLEQIGARINDFRAESRAAADKSIREYWGEDSPYRRIIRPPTAEEAAAMAATASPPYASARTQSHPAATGSVAPISGSGSDEYQRRRMAAQSAGIVAPSLWEGN